jgi:DNA replication protein DnaC
MTGFKCPTRFEAVLTPRGMEQRGSGWFGSSWTRALQRKIDLVVIDDLGLAPLTSAERHDLLSPRRVPLCGPG